MSRFDLSLTFFVALLFWKRTQKAVCNRFIFSVYMLSYQGFQCVKTWHASCLYKGVKQNKENLGDEGKWQKQLC